MLAWKLGSRGLWRGGFGGCGNCGDFAGLGGRSWVFSPGAWGLTLQSRLFGYLPAALHDFIQYHTKSCSGLCFRSLTGDYSAANAAHALVLEGQSQDA